jgi:hypothetical protein
MLPISSYANLLSNGGFENGTGETPDNWWKWSNNWGWAGWNSGGAHSGDKYVYVGGYENGQFAYFGQSLYEVSPLAVYEYSVWAKTEDWGSPTGSLFVEFKDTNNESLRVDTLELFNGSKSNTWTQYTLTTGPTPEGTTSINFVLCGGVSGTAQFDDAEATIIPEPASIILLSGLALFLKRK